MGVDECNHVCSDSIWCQVIFRSHSTIDVTGIVFDSLQLGWSEWLESASTIKNKHCEYDTSVAYLGQEYTPHFFESETCIVLTVFCS